MVLRILLICGIIASLIYVGSDIIAALSWEGYSYKSQSVSELRAIGAPTRAFLVPVLFAYAVFEIAFGFGIRRSAGRSRALSIAGALLIALGFLDLSGYFFPLDLSQSVEGPANTIHLIVTAVTVILLLMIIIFGSSADGKWFRLYSYITLLVFIIAGILSFLEVSSIKANLPTPWLGVRERINIYGYMLWVIVLAVVLLSQRRAEKV